MHRNTVTLESGDEIEVRRLGLFELDQFEPDPVGPYMYEVAMATGTYMAPYDPSRWPTPPQPPEEVEPEEGTEAWYQLREYTTYQAAVLHEEKRVRAMADYCLNVGRYIVSNCLPLGAAAQIATISDYRLVYAAALNPFVEEGEIAAVLRSSFPGQL